ncbi:hypothetical protein Gpo141_00006316 [Globisporangium polare]
MYPQDLLAANSNEPSTAGFLPALRKRPAPTDALIFPQQHQHEQEQELLSDSSDDDDQASSSGSSKRFKPSSPAPSSTSSSPSYATKSPAMTPSRQKTTTSSATRPNMSASHSITLEMLQPHFETPLAQVAKQFGICVTLLKKICRKHGISRWPHRQITGLRKSISSMEHAIGYFEGARRESYAEQLRKQKTKLALLLEDPTKCNPLPVASRLMGQQHYHQQQQYQFESHQDEYYQASVTSSPASSSSFPSPQQLNRVTAFPVMSQQLHQTHQQLITPVDYMSRAHQRQQLSCTRPASPETFFPSPAPGGFLPLPRPQQQLPQQQQQQFYLPPLRTEPRRMLPPIASLVAGNASW